MDDIVEIDLKKIINTILSKWYWIIGIGLMCGIVVFLISFLSPDVYSTKATIALVEPRYSANFSSDITTSSLKPPSEEFINAAVFSNTIVTELFSAWENPKKTETTVEQFRVNILEAKLEKSSSIIILQVTTESPAEAQSLTNLWADLSVNLINASYYGIEQDQISYFAVQIEESLNNYTDSGNALVAYAETDDLSMLRSTLNALNAQFQDTLQREQALNAAKLDTQGLIEFISNAPGDAVVRESDLLVFTLIQTRVYGSPVTSGLANSPVQLQLGVNYSPEDKLTSQEFVKIMNDWIVEIEAGIIELASTRNDITEIVTSLQAEIIAKENEKSLLKTTYELSESTYKALITKFEEVKLTTNADQGYAKLLSSAITPEEPLPHNTITKTLIACVAGSVISIVGVLFIDWWKKEEQTQETVQ